MIKDRIQVLQHDIDLELSVSIPLTERSNFMKELAVNIEDEIHNGSSSGMEPMYYTEEISEQELETDVDVMWSIVNWKEIAEKLYKELIQYENKSESVLKLYRDANK